MNMIIAGVLIWSIVHLMKSVTPGVRGSIQRAIGEGPHKRVEHLSRESRQACLSFETIDEAREKLSSQLVQGDHLLLKASRGARLERLAEFLLANDEGGVEMKEGCNPKNNPTAKK